MSKFHRLTCIALIFSAIWRADACWANGPSTPAVLTLTDKIAAGDIEPIGANLTSIAYEGGPSGYWQNKEKPEVDELHGKSVAMGLAALDAWLYSSYHGFRHQCYLGFSSGKWWSSHTLPEAGGFRPHVGWLTLQMRNRYARGDRMQEIAFESVPTYRRNDQEVPLQIEDPSTP